MSDIIKKLTDKQDYCNNMATTVADKLWYQDHVPTYHSLFDIGCADGALLDSCDAQIAIGYDNDPDMIALAYKRFADDIFTTSSWADAINRLKEWQFEIGYPIVMNLASTLHEVPSLNTFAVWVTDAKPEYISIRDLGITMSEQCGHFSTLPDDLRTHMDNCPWIDEFEDEHTWQRIYSTALLWLLKQQWQHTPNFMDDLSENYFLHTIDSVMARIVNLGYKITHFERYMPAGLRDQIARDYGIVGPYCTHYKLLAERIT